MRPSKMYLETSVWSHLSAEDAPEKRKYTEALMQEIQTLGHLIFVSVLVFEELDQTPDTDLKRKLLTEVRRSRPRIIQLSDEATRLADHYRSAGIVPDAAENDALHMAQATVEDLDIVVSWNMRHMVRLKTRQGVNAVNKLNGYREIEIVTPEEVLEYGEND